MEIDNFVEKMKLLNIYKDLLSEKQKSYMCKHFEEDYSLSEIAEMHNVSRQAVYDNIKRSSLYLENLEDKIGYLKREDKIKDKLRQLESKFTKEELRRIIEEI